MQFRLRTLLILLAILPPLLAVVWWGYGRWRERLERKRLYWEFTLKAGAKLIEPPADSK
jgi:hypothetical protein